MMDQPAQPTPRAEATRASHAQPHHADAERVRERSVWYRTTRGTRTTRAAALLALLGPAILALTQLVGCDVVAAVTYVVAPRQLHKAVYPLPDKRTVILVEVGTSDLSDPSVPRNIAANIEKWLKDEKAIQKATIVTAEELESYLASFGDNRNRVGMNQIAEHFDAEQLIHVKIVSYQMAVGGGVYRPDMTSQVKLVDNTGQRLMPVDKDPETGISTGTSFITVQSKLPAINRTSEGNSASVIASQNLAAQAGEDIAKLFFDWREDEPGENLGRP